MIALTFHGAARTVTGSRFLLEAGQTKVLLDCGLFQGYKKLRLRNREEPGFRPSSVDAVVLTHAHIDHSGYLPKLVQLGFHGPIYCTPATADLADLLLRDCAAIQEEDAAYANKKGYSRHKPALPLFTTKDAEKAIGLLNVVDYNEFNSINGAVRFRFRHAGHILGSGIVEMDVADNDRELRFLFSGDVGRYDAPLVPDPTTPEPCDVLVVESTYGDRTHPESSIQTQMAELVRKTVANNGILLIPSFAVARAQQIIYLLRQAMEAEEVPELPVHLDSPMAVNATKIYQRYPEEHGLDDADLKPGDSVLFDRKVYLHRTRDESIRLNSLAGPRVIISSSGMMTGGRILHHLRRLIPDPKNLIVLSGYQAAGTRGRRLRDGAKTIRMHGRDIPVRAELAELSGLSAHADSNELMRWISPMDTAPQRTFVVHGEEDSSLAFAKRLEKERGFSTTVPDHGERFEL